MYQPNAFQMMMQKMQGMQPQQPFQPMGPPTQSGQWPGQGTPNPLGAPTTAPQTGFLSSLPAGSITGALGAVPNVMNAVGNWSNPKERNSSLGSAAGSVGGAIGGTALGSLLGPAGMALGGMLGSMGGSAGGGFLGGLFGHDEEEKKRKQLEQQQRIDGLRANLGQLAEYFQTGNMAQAARGRNIF